MLNLRDCVAEIKARTDCRDLAEELGLPRKWNSFLCPFHDDKNPSLSVKSHGYYCFACGAKGDLIKLVMQVKGIGFREALEYLAHRCGVVLPSLRSGSCPRPRTTTCSLAAPHSPTERDDDEPCIDPEQRTAIFTTLARAVRVREGELMDAPAFAYLTRRGISEATAVRAGLGFLPNYEAASQTLRERVPLSDLQSAGLFNVKGNFRLFKHQLLIPYWIEDQAVTLQAHNIAWRDKGDGAKELTIGPITIPFNADVLLEPQETVYVCEGAIDTLSLLELGFVAIGIPGTAISCPIGASCSRIWERSFSPSTTTRPVMRGQR